MKIEADLNLIELSSHELLEIEGGKVNGFWVFAAAVVGAILGALVVSAVS